jgi:hypothetical protein
MGGWKRCSPRAAAGIVRHLVHSVGITPTRARHQRLPDAHRRRPSRPLGGLWHLHPDMANMRERRLGASGGRAARRQGHPDFQRICLDSDAALAMLRALAERACRCWRTPVVKTLPIQRAGAHGARPQSVAGGEGHLRPPGRLVGMGRRVETAGRPAQRLGGYVFQPVRAHPEEAAAIIRHYDGARVFFGTDYPMWDPVEERRALTPCP